MYACRYMGNRMHIGILAWLVHWSPYKPIHRYVYKKLYLNFMGCTKEQSLHAKRTKPACTIGAPQKSYKKLYSYLIMYMHTCTLKKATNYYTF